MAETAVRTKTKLGWAKSGMESSSDDEDAIVPGVNKTGSGNLRPRVRPRHRRDVRSKVSQQPATVEDVPSATTLSVQDLSQSLDERRLGPTGGGKRSQVSLKDLCVEDKRRIANLIRELAKVGEEREKAREDLEKERRSYEQQILKLVEQQEQILRERQEVEKHLQECQQLLAQSQPLHPPPPSRSASLPHPPLSTGIAPPPSFPVPPYPQWAWSEGEGWGQELHQSLLGNVGSPDRQTGHPAGPYPQPQTLTPSVPAPSHPVHSNQAPPHPSPLPNHPAYSHPHHHYASGDSAPHHSHPPSTHPQHLPSPHPAYTHPLPHATNSRPPQKPPASDFFANAMQQSEPLDMFASKGAPSHPALLNIQTSKEDVIERFFASQPANLEPQLVSPKRRDPRKPSKTRLSNPHQPFPKPVMSSTQKSAEIKDCLSVDSEFVPLVPDESSVKSDGDGGGRRREEEKGDGVSRVMFREGGGKEELHLHSPLGDAGDDAHTAHTYLKMSQTQRKEQLLQQRALLLEEQQRLKHILTEQEAMLNEKQRALQARSQHRHGNNVNDDDDGDSEGGDVNGDDDDDPLGLVPQRLAIDAALERQRAIVDNLEMEAKQRAAITSKPTTTTTTSTSTSASASRPTGGVLPQQERKERGREGSGKKERREKGGETFVIHNHQLSDIVRKLDYSLHSDTEEMEEDRESERASSSDDEDDDKENEEATEEEHSPPSVPALRQEASTSMSFRTIPRSSHGGKENVLDDGGEGDHHPPPAFSSPSLQTQTPGEKTMSVLEIINSLPSPRPSDTAILAPRLSPRMQEFSPLHQQHRDLSPLSRWRGKEDYDVEIVVMDSSEDDDDVHDDHSDAPNNEEFEESQILEDIFFLK